MHDVNGGGEVGSSACDEKAYMQFICNIEVFRSMLAYLYMFPVVWWLASAVNNAKVVLQRLPVPF